MKSIRIDSQDFEVQHRSGSLRLHSDAEHLFIDCSSRETLAALPLPSLWTLWGYWRRFRGGTAYLEQSIELRVEQKLWLRLKAGKIEKFAFWKFLGWWLRYKLF